MGARKQNVSLNQLVRDFLTALVEKHSRRRMARARLKQMMDSGLVETGEKSWTRDDLYVR